MCYDFMLIYFVSGTKEHMKKGIANDMEIQCVGIIVFELKSEH